MDAKHRRKWNNRLIFAVIAFISVLNLPTVIKHWLIEQSPPLYPHLLNPNAELQSLYFGDWQLELIDGEWQSNILSTVNADEWATRWQSLVGTAVDSESFSALKPGLPAPSTIEIWYQRQEEPQRITVYMTDQFWLMQNWQQDWIAISVDSHYLIP